MKDSRTLILDASDAKAEGRCSIRLQRCMLLFVYMWYDMSYSFFFFLVTVHARYHIGGKIDGKEIHVYHADKYLMNNRLLNNFCPFQTQTLINRPMRLLKPFCPNLFNSVTVLFVRQIIKRNCNLFVLWSSLEVNIKRVIVLIKLDNPWGISCFFSFLVWWIWYCTRFICKWCYFSYWLTAVAVQLNPL